MAPIAPSILSAFDLKGAQQTAAERLDAHLAVTAGAGSGKTRTLVARYLHFVERGAPLRALVAITFTEKAAREMRSRIRSEIENWLAISSLPSSDISTTGEPRQRGLRSHEPGPALGEVEGVRADLWQTAFIELDAARIGTIHSLCADLLRLYPAEAGVDPHFAVLDEGLAAALQAQAVETALAWAATDREAARLFGAFKEGELRRLLQSLLVARLDAAPLFLGPDPLVRWEGEVSRWLGEHLAAPAWLDSLAALAEYSSHHPDDKLEIARREVLAHWGDLQRAQAAADWDAALRALRLLRKSISTAGQKSHWDPGALETVREAMVSLRITYEAALEPLAKAECRWALDQQAAGLLPAARRLFEHAVADYQALKDDRRALDFDDLEGGAARLLMTGVRAEPRERGASHGLGVTAVLVDEFQDTNERQRQIVYALAGFDAPHAPPLKTVDPSSAEGLGARANLFIVGDAKQGIYRFRGADVAVFRRIQEDIAGAGGEVIDLDLTFRAHAPLLALTNRLLAPLMGEADDPARPYRVPFAPLTAHRAAPREGVREPFVEFHVGLGDQATTGRQAAAAALAARLRVLHAQERFEWEDVALLFRASTAFTIYEGALEAAGIPFVTVAGRGFYDRPEIRDVLNALAAIADPTDDLALAGLLRSPAFGLTDADLYRLRFSDGGATPRALHRSLLANPHALTPNPPLAHAAQTVRDLHALAGRLPVAELLKEFLDRTHYRAVLKRAGGFQRLSRNVDKLLADAHRSRLVSVGDFLEYVQALRDVGAREGEAPADPSTGSGGGAVQLMTVHKAKGLEFPLVVIADAGYAHGGADGAAVRLDPVLGVLLKVQARQGSDATARPFAWQLGALADADKEEAEDLRLLYVAATRAKEKILVSGHAKISTDRNDPGRLLPKGWLARLASVVGMDGTRLRPGEFAAPLELQLSPDWAGQIAVTLHPPPVEQAQVSPSTAPIEPLPTLVPGPLVASLPAGPLEGGPAIALSRAEGPALSEVEGTRAPAAAWRVSPSEGDAPAWVVGKIVHAALRRWLFPDRPDFDARLRPVALEAGLLDETAVRGALREARRLLERFRAHPLFAELAAAERHHEVPYAVGGDAGVLDLLYRERGRWTVADVKTDELRDEAEMRVRIRAEGYDRQVRRYASACAAPLGQRPRSVLVFLNVGGEVRLIDLSDGSTAGREEAGE